MLNGPMRKVPRYSSTYPRTAYRTRRAALLRRFAVGPVGTTRRFASRTFRELPLYAPLPVSRNEMKYVDIAQAVYPGDNSGSVTHLNPIIIGSLVVGQREGSRVMLCGTQLRGAVLAGTTGTVSKATLVLVYDKQPNGALPNISPDIFETTASDSFQTTANRSRFDILGRWDYTLVGNSTTLVTGREYFNVDLKSAFRKVAVYNEQSNSGAIGTMVSGSLLLLTFGDTGTGTSAPAFQLQCRTMYGDN
jgi:hypothetical protein